MALKEIDEQNAYSRSNNDTAVFGISSTSDIPSARLGYNGDAALLDHYEGEPVKTEGVSADEAVETEITSSAPMKNSLSRVHGPKRPFVLPAEFMPDKSMAKYDADFADI